jgi:hypothetical protein
MTLIKLVDIQVYLCEKYECNWTQVTLILADKKHKRGQRSQLIATTKAGKKDLRRLELEEALAKYKLVIRGDSRLCNGYIDGTLKDWNISQIVKRMCQMKYLYEYTDFQKIYDNVWRHQDRYYSDPEEVFEEAEHMTIKKNGGYPRIFPWMDT